MTEANTRERQDLLLKVKTAGQFFHVTNGGGPMNGTDALMAWTQKDMQAEATRMLKTKQSLDGFASTTRKVTELLGLKPETNWKTWTAAELKLVMCWKQGHSPQEPHNGMHKQTRKPGLQKLFEEKYLEAPDPVGSMWTEEMEEKLQRLQSGNIEDVHAECGLRRALDLDDEEITIRIKSKGPRRKAKIITDAFRSLGGRQKRQSVIDELSLLVGLDEEDSIAEADSGIFADSDDENEDDLFGFGSTV